MRRQAEVTHRQDPHFKKRAERPDLRRDAYHHAVPLTEAERVADIARRAAASKSSPITWLLEPVPLVPRSGSHIRVVGVSADCAPAIRKAYIKLGGGHA